jgi:hypothetical protein
VVTLIAAALTDGGSTQRQTSVAAAAFWRRCRSEGALGFLGKKDRSRKFVTPNPVPAWLREQIWGAVIFFSVKGILFPQRCGNRFGGVVNFWLVKGFCSRSVTGTDLEG